MKYDRLKKQERLKLISDAYMRGTISKEALYKEFFMPKTVIVDGTIVDPKWYVKEVDGKLTKLEDM